MSESDFVTWKGLQKEAREKLDERFPDFKCLRCGSTAFLQRTFPDSSFSPGLADPNVMELICANCGFLERHVLEGLRGKLKGVAAGTREDG
jgi:hypothetical protein